jgi:hypothetical protein
MAAEKGAIRMTAEKVMLFGGCAAFLLTLYAVRQRNLREKYAVMWIVAAGVLFVLGLFPGIIKSLADASRLAYPSAVLLVSLAAIYVFSMSVSVSLTRQHRAAVRLNQEVALLRIRLSRLEQRLLQGGTDNGKTST